MESFTVSKQYPLEKLKDTLRGHGSLNNLVGRATGQTTGIAMAMIGESMTNPEKYVKVYKRNSKYAESLKSVIDGLICKLSLRYIEVKAQGTEVLVCYRPTQVVLVHKGEIYVKA